MSANSQPRLRVVLLCCDGPYQRDLATRLHLTYDLVGIVKVVVPGIRGSLASRLRRLANPIRLVRHLVARRSQRRGANAARRLFEDLFHIGGREPAYPEGVSCIEVSNVNHPDAVALIRSVKPDIVCVNGTNLLRQPMLALIPEIPNGIINLHTGLSPYTRGGNCNLYALLEKHPEWVGVTIHHIDAGIDSGDLIRTAQVPMQAGDLYDHIDVRTFRLGNDLLVESLAKVAAGTAPRVPQWMPGRLYLKRTGFVYQPWHWHRVNRMLEAGLLRRYLSSPEESGSKIRLVE